ncbi:hypothetical protein DFR50_104163 [Roseiarcus fermentans]|uniref:MerR-like DNA binding protein n=1 Tax=Roseiarcus fermentans TaxID=1473586 RepID=A0A366FT24_9HYPH|nr:hypothetical protein DFR50_104163 [Roseiarcus fermentans]
MSQRHHFIPITIAAHRLGLSIGFLRLARRTGLGPPFVDAGGELCYHWPSVVAWARRTGFDRNLDPQWARSGAGGARR